MEAYSYAAEELYDAIFTEQEDFLLLDVRNNEEFGKFSVEGPFLKQMINIPYFEFLEQEDESIKKVPTREKIKIVCAKEGSAKYVAGILLNAGFKDVGFLSGGIGTWADLLKPQLVEENDRFSLFQFVRPGKASLSYGMVCGEECFIFDPARIVNVYLDFAESHNVNITKIFETHLQADYISGSQRLSALSNSQIFAHKDDFGIASFKYNAVEDGQTIKSASDSVDIKVIHTPGHTPGSTSYLIEDRFLISGDAVFIKSIGRPDLGGKVEEWSGFLFDTIQNVLKKINDTVQVMPGHYMDWSEMTSEGLFVDSLGHIMTINDKIYSLEDVKIFTAFIKENMRPQPGVYAEIRKVNSGLLDPSEDEQVIMDVGKNECAASNV